MISCIQASAEENVAILARMLGALDTIGSLAIRGSHIQALDEQLQWIAELADRTIEAGHDCERIERQLSVVRETLETQSAYCVPSK